MTALNTADKVYVGSNAADKVYLGTNLVWQPAASGFDPASSAIFAAFTTPPSPARQTLIDNCVVALKSAGVWAKLDALYAFAAADSQAALINWKAPGTYNATLVNAPAFAVDVGFTGASTKYIDSGFNPTTAPTPNYVRDSASFFGWVTTALDQNIRMLGYISGANQAYIIPLTGGNTWWQINGSADDSIANANGAGLFALSRTGATAPRVDRNGTTLKSSASVSAALQNAKFEFLGAVGSYWTGQMSAGGFGAGLSGADSTALYNALYTYLVGVGAVYQAESTAIFNAFTTPPTSARKTLIDNCVVALKNAGVWAKLDALYAFAAADSQAALINWKQPGTYNGTLVNSPSFTADRGFTGNGTTSYIDSTFNPTTALTPQYAQDGASVLGWGLTDINGNASVLVGGNTTTTLIFPRIANTAYFNVNQTAGNGTAANAVGTGCYVASRTLSNLTTLYKNGSSLGTTAAASSARVNQNIWFLHRGVDYGSAQIAGGGIGGGLTGADNTALYNALRAYMTGVGVP